MLYFNNTLCISFGELVNKTAQPNIVGKDAFISRYDYQNYKNSGKLKTVRPGCRGTDALYDFEQLPQQIKSAVAKKFKDVVKAAQQEPVKAALQNDYKAHAFFSNYTLPNGEHLKENTIREYTSTAVALNAIIKLQSDTKAWRSALGGSSAKTGSLINLIDVLAGFQKQWGWKIPNTDRGLRGKLKDYRERGYVALISGKLCNDNAAKVVETEQEAVLRRVMALGRNLDDVQVMTMYNMTAEVAGWKKITKGTVANYRDQWQVFTDAGRRGKDTHDNSHAMQNKRRAPLAPLLYWTADTWDVELLYQKYVERKDKEGNLRNATEYHHRMSIAVVLDPCGKYPVGYAIGDHETPALIRQAFRNAVKHTEELFGQMHHVYELQTDNYSSKTLTPFYEAISKHYTPARIKNAKAKVIEPYFKHLNKTYCQLQANWSGFGMKARKENQPNAEYLNKIQKSHPDQAGCIAQIVKMMEAERAAKRAAYIEAYQNIPADKVLTWTKAEYLKNLGERPKDTIKLYGHGVPLQVNKQKYTYDSFDQTFRMYRNEDWIIRYDPDDMSEVLALNADGSLQFMLNSKFVQPMALAERAEGDAIQLKAVNDFNKQLEQTILNVQENDWEAINGLMKRNTRIEETLGKLLIVDSDGQHKDNRNAARLQQSARLLEERQDRKQEKAQQKAEHKTKTQLQNEYTNSIIDINEFLS